MEENNEEYKIKVNKTFINKDTINNITNQNKKNSIKKSILYKLKFNPEIIINQFHQTSNNINTNINIKKDKLRNSEYIGRNDNNILEDNNDSNIYSPNKYFHSYDDDNFEREGKNNEYIYNNTYTNAKSMEEDSKSIANKKYNLYEEYSPLTNRIHHYNNTTYRERNPFIKNIKFNQLTKQKMKISEYIIQNPKRERNINKFVRPKTDRNKKINKFNINNNDVLETENNNIYSNRRKNLKKRIRQLSQEEISTSNKEKIYNKKRNISMNLRNNYNTAVSEGIFSFNDKTFKKNIEEYLYTNYNINQDSYKNIMDSNEKYNSNTFVDWNKHKALNIKLMNYRIKLFSQFFIHFEKYYRSYLRNYKSIFFNKIKYYHHRKRNTDVNFSYKKKSKIDKNSAYYNSNKKENNEVDMNNKFATTYNYYYSDKNNIIYLDIKSSILNKLQTKEDVNYNSSLTEFPKNILNTSSRKKESICFSDRKRIINKSFIDSLTKSPLSSIGNRTSRNNGFNFGRENNEKENELFRSFEELNKKGEQIKRRKKSKNAKEKMVATNLNSKKVDENKNIKKIKDTKEYGQFSELRKNVNKNNNNNDIKNLKADNIQNRNSKLNLENNYNKKLLNWYPKTNRKLKNNYIKYTHKNKILNSKTINDKKINKSNINISNTFSSYRKVKINNNKNPLIGKKQFKIFKNNKPNNKNNNETKKNIYYNKNKSELIEKVPKLINEIKTNDNRIHINIFYYNYSSKNKTSFKKYNSLHEIKNFSMNLINNNDFITKNRIKDIKSKKLLSSIKEEETSNQNSRILDESATPFNLDNINEENNSKELIISQFINIIETILIHIYKRILFFRIKTINIVNKMDKILFNNDKKKNIYHKKNKSTQIYSKKLGIKVQKKIKNEENKSGSKPKKIQMERWIKRINVLRQILIFYALNKND